MPRKRGRKPGLKRANRHPLAFRCLFFDDHVDIGSHAPHVQYVRFQAQALPVAPNAIPRHL